MRTAASRISSVFLASAALRTRGQAVRVAVDLLAWAVALPFASAVRYDLAETGVDVFGLVVAVLVAVVLQGLVGWAFGLYSNRYRLGSFEEIAALGTAVASVTAGLFFAVFLVPVEENLVPLTATVGGGFVAVVLMLGARLAWRSADDRLRRPNLEDSHRLVVYGAGEGGQQVITSLLRDPQSPYLPVAVIDDDLRLANRRVRGVPVKGTGERMAEVAAESGADTVLIAIPTAPAELVRRITTAGRAAGLDVRIVPSTRELIEGAAGLTDLRPPNIADLLGRHEIDTDIESIAGYIVGRRVLVTGAGGSIGSELCRQIHRFAPSRLVMLDRDESALHAVQLSIEGRALLDSPDLVLCDIRDRERLVEAFEEHRPEVVFHAAALKHLPLLERHPAEAVKTNVRGTGNVLDAAAAVGVERFVNISTDKAADPTSVLGTSKRIGERMTAWAAATEPGVFLSVRFGNVLGSRGSVLETFTAQIAAGGPVTLTHEDVTRYFMTVEEACQLTVQAAAIGEAGEALVLDMGEPVRIADVLRQLIAGAERPVEMVVTGLREGEKLHEVLLGAGEEAVCRFHPLIQHVVVPPLAPDTIEAIDAGAERAEVIAQLDGLTRLPAAAPRSS